MSGYTVKPPTGDTNEQTQFIDYFNLFYSKRGQEQISISQQLGMLNWMKPWSLSSQLTVLLPEQHLMHKSAGKY